VSKRTVGKAPTVLPMVAYTSKRFHDRDPKLFQAVYKALTEAMDRVRRSAPKVKPTSWKDYFFPEAYGLPGS
jgi:hypothetical protein